MIALTRRSFLRTAGAGAVAAGAAFVGPHLPDLGNHFWNTDEIDLSGLDAAYILDPTTGLYTISHPKNKSAALKGVDLKQVVLERSADEQKELPVPADLEEAVAYYTQAFSADPHYQAQILVGPNRRVGRIDGGTEEAGAWGFPIGPVYVSGGTNYGHVGGCIKRTTHYAAFRVTQNGGSAVYVDIHVASWYSGGQQCFGIYESRSGWCYARCVPKIDVNALLSPLASGVAAALPWWLDYLSWPVAYAAAGLVLGVLIAIPVVPPPP